MRDIELLEAAARAAGYADFHDRTGGLGNVIYYIRNVDGFELRWNPLTDDGDALRLAVKLCIPFHVFPEHQTVIAYGKKTDRHQEGFDAMEAINNADPYAATRRAIVRAAAALANRAASPNTGESK